MARHSRKDYETVAEILRSQYVLGCHESHNHRVAVVEEIVNEFSRVFKADNSRFDADRFYYAVFNDIKKEGA